MTPRLTSAVFRLGPRGPLKAKAPHHSTRGPCYYSRRNSWCAAAGACDIDEVVISSAPAFLEDFLSLVLGVAVTSRVGCAGNHRNKVQPKRRNRLHI